MTFAVLKAKVSHSTTLLFPFSLLLTSLSPSGSLCFHVFLPLSLPYFIQLSFHPSVLPSLSPSIHSFLLLSLFPSIPILPSSSPPLSLHCLGIKYKYYNKTMYVDITLAEVGSPLSPELCTIIIPSLTRVAIL